MIAKAYAKINWYLDIKGKFPNGYHDLEMVMQRIELHDTLYIESRSDQSLRLTVEGAPSLATAQENLVLKAAQLLRAYSGSMLGADIRLVKRIPMGGGLGGGSADAAVALSTLNILWRLAYSREELQQIGVKAGADVPYCLEPRPAIVRGIGEKISPLRFERSCWLLLLKPEASLSTKEVFANYRHTEHSGANLHMTISCLERGEYAQLKEVCINALQPAAAGMLPLIDQLISLLYENGASFAQMSGSGSTVFGVFSSYDAAAQASAGIRLPCERFITKTAETAEAL